MAAILFLAFVFVPIIEIGVFIQVGGWIGLWPTLAVIVLTAVIGTALLRQQGLATLTRAQQEMATGHMPVRELFDGVCLLAAGALLLTPGFVTDAVGFALFTPIVRTTFGRWLWHMAATRGQFHTNTRHGRAQRGAELADVEYEEVDIDIAPAAKPRPGNGIGSPDQRNDSP